MRNRNTSPNMPSVRVVPPAISRIRGSAHAIWAALQDRGAEVAPVRVSQASLARQTGLSRPTVRRSLDKLESAGYAQRDGDMRRARWQIFWEAQVNP